MNSSLARAERNIHSPGTVRTENIQTNKFLEQKLIYERGTPALLYTQYARTHAQTTHSQSARAMIRTHVHCAAIAYHCDMVARLITTFCAPSPIHLLAITITQSQFRNLQPVSVAEATSCHTHWSSKHSRTNGSSAADRSCGRAASYRGQ